MSVCMYLCVSYFLWLATWRLTSRIVCMRQFNKTTPVPLTGRQLGLVNFCGLSKQFFRIALNMYHFDLQVNSTETFVGVLLVKYTITKPFRLLCRGKTETAGKISLAEHLRAFRSLVHSGTNLQRWGWVDSEAVSVPASGWGVGSSQCCVQGCYPVSQSDVRLDHV